MAQEIKVNIEKDVTDIVEYLIKPGNGFHQEEGQEENLANDCAMV